MPRLPPAWSKADLAFDVLVGTNVEVKIHHYEPEPFFEGPVWHHGTEGSFLTFSDLVATASESGIRKRQRYPIMFHHVWTRHGFCFRHAFRTGGKLLCSDRTQLSVTLDDMGHLVFAAMGSGRIMGREADGSLSVLANAYDGHHLNA